MSETIYAVDANNLVLGPVDKVAAHQGEGVLHRAITVALVNDHGQILLTQRSQQKPLWPYYWDAACSTHPWFPSETVTEAAHRRIREELGIYPSKVKDWQTKPAYEYHAVYSPQWSENEINFLITGRYTGPVEPNPTEVATYSWKTVQEIEQELVKPNNLYVPWFAPAWPNIAKLATKS